LPAQCLHLGDREARIMRNDDHFGGFENLTKGRNELTF
jgi:hypothetical protein